jgi:hypothetical protein
VAATLGRHRRAGALAGWPANGPIAAEELAPAAVQPLSCLEQALHILAGGGRVPQGASPWALVFALYGYLLPFVLYAAWTSLALWDLARRDDLGRGAAIGWIAVILLVPFPGVIAYHVLGRPKLPAWLRAAVVGGGLVAYLVVPGSAPSLAGSPRPPRAREPSPGARHVGG